MSRIEKVKEIIEKYCQSTKAHSQEVEEDFTYWITSNRNEEEKDEALLAFWSVLDVAQDDFTEVAYKNIQTRIRVESPTKSKKIVLKNLWKYAAAIALIIGSLSIFLLNNNTTQELMVECVVPERGAYTLTLSDSSLVCLSPKSLFKYPQVFQKDGDREVYLSGEAFFSIAHMDNKPFKVRTDNLLVKVLGTKFNLNCFNDQDYSTLLLKEGKVEVSVDDKSIVMVPNQKLIYNHSNKALEIMIMPSTEGNISFKGASIREVISGLEGRFDNVVILLNTSRYDDSIITIQFSQNESLSDCLDALSLLVPDLQYKIQDRNVYIE